MDYQEFRIEAQTIYNNLNIMYADNEVQYKTMLAAFGFAPNTPYEVYEADGGYIPAADYPAYLDAVVEIRDLYRAAGGNDADFHKEFRAITASRREWVQSKTSYETPPTIPGIEGVTRVLAEKAHVMVDGQYKTYKALLATVSGGRVVIYIDKHGNEKLRQPLYKSQFRGIIKEEKARKAAEKK